MKLPLTIVLFFLFAVNSFSQSQEEQLCTAIEEEEGMSKIEELLKAGADANCYCSITKNRVRNNFQKKIDRLVKPRQTPSDTYTTTKEGTPLNFVIKQKNYGAVQLLMKYGADPFFKGSRTINSPVGEALTSKKLELLKILLEDSPLPKDWTKKVRDVNFAIDLAKKKIVDASNFELDQFYNLERSCDILAELLELGVPVDELSKEKGSPFDPTYPSVLYCSCPELIDGYPPSQKTFERLYFDWESVRDTAPIVLRFLKNGFKNFNIKGLNSRELFSDKPRFTRLIEMEILDPNLQVTTSIKIDDGSHFAHFYNLKIYLYILEVWGTDLELIELCLKKGADLSLVGKLKRDSTDKYREEFTLLRYALAQDNDSFIDMVLKYNPAINTVEYFGETAIYEAIKKGNLRVVKKMVEMGADLTVKDVGNFTPLNIAKKYKSRHQNPELIQYLKTQTKLQIEN